MFIKSKSQVKQLSTYKGTEPDSSNYSLSSRPGIYSVHGLRTRDFKDSVLIPLADMIHVFYYDRNVQMENIVFNELLWWSSFSLYIYMWYIKECSQTLLNILMHPLIKKILKKEFRNIYSKHSIHIISKEKSK